MLNKKAIVTVKTAEDFSMSKLQKFEGFIFTIKPFTKKVKSKEFKLKDQLKCAFHWYEDGMTIEDIAKCFQDIAKLIREHYLK